MMDDRKLLVKLILYFKLKKFCKENEEKCWSRRNCEDCPINARIVELEDEIMLNI